jgi:hypothetical protein
MLSRYKRSKINLLSFKKEFGLYGGVLRSLKVWPWANRNGV